MAIYCNIVVAYSNNIVSVASSVQKAVADAVSSITGVKVRMVNVNVCEIVRQ